MPDSDALPADLRPLVDIHAMSVNGDPAFRRDTTHLIDAVRFVVSNERARLDRERQAAAERARQDAATLAERQRQAEELRAEQRAALARLAELEEANTRRQIELERARLEDIRERLRRAELSGDRADTRDGRPTNLSAAAAERPSTRAVEPAAEDAADPVVGAEREVATGPDGAVDPPVAPDPQAERRAEPIAGSSLGLQLLLVGALVLCIVALFVNRSTYSPFTELSGSTTEDVIEWIVTLSIVIPLVLASRPVEQRFVLLGVTGAAVCFGLLQSSVTLRFGPTNLDEGGWFMLKASENACLVGACWIARRHTDRSKWSKPSLKVAAIALTLLSGAALVRSTLGEWDGVTQLVDNGDVGDRLPLPIWLGVLVGAPLVILTSLAVRRGYGARIALGTFAALAAIAAYGEGLVLERLAGFDKSRWTQAAFVELALAVVAFAGATGPRTIATTGVRWRSTGSDRPTRR